METEGSAELLARIAAETQTCALCDLCRGARQAVPGSGDPHAEVLLIGEAPSYYDDRGGLPFSGPSGVFLDELLALAGLTRTQVFLTNLVKHRVPEGRDLAPSEIGACANYLTRQIAAINPLVIVTLGRHALARFIPRAKISAIHGQAKVHEGRVLVAMFNPAAALHREELRQTVTDDFARALPAAVAEAHRLEAEGTLRPTPDQDDDQPRQMALF